MKKIQILLLCILCGSNVMADDISCEEGTIIYAKTCNDTTCDSGCTKTTCNGHTFCRSNVKLNWWSTFAWCKAQGLYWPKFEVMCPGIRVGVGYCTNLKGKLGETWTSFGTTGGDALFIANTSGQIIEGWRNNMGYTTSGGYALCVKEKELSTEAED